MDTYTPVTGDVIFWEVNPVNQTQHWTKLDGEKNTPIMTGTVLDGVLSIK